jgi:hypothetical protein
MADVVAIVSVIVTGVVAPAIAVIATRMQVNLTGRVTLTKEYRDVLDEGADKLAKLARASGHVITLWSNGVRDDANEVRRELQARNQAGELMLTSYSRICIRFGENSEVAQTYARAIAQIDRYLEPLGDYRRGGEYDRWNATLAEIGSAVRVATTEYTKAAHSVIHKIK